jgi:hypothetical protein
MVKLNQWQQMVRNFIFYLIELFCFLIDEHSNKRPISPNEKCEKIEYLIRDALDRNCPAIVKRDGKISFKNYFHSNLFFFSESMSVFQKSPSKRLRYNIKP